MSFTVCIQKGEHRVKTEYGKPVRISDAIAESGLFFDHPCGGQGRCGNCRVKVRGSVNAPSQKERELLGALLDDGVRLSCDTFAVGDVKIEIPTPDGETALIIADSSSDGIYGCAIDIGTTVVEICIIDRESGNRVYTDRFNNPQRIYGADVLSRIGYALGGGANTLESLLNTAIERSINGFKNKIREYSVVGNTAMQYIASGVNTEDIARAPFVLTESFGKEIGGKYYAPCAGAYIGSDVIASYYANKVQDLFGNIVLLDIGTNNECILKANGRLYACSSPAGPAFEGANISCGSAAVPSAIYKIEDSDGTPIFYTVDESEAPKSICGSGLIDACAFLIDNGYISSDGTIIKDLPDFGGLRLTQDDLSALQLAKSAVCAGLLTLCNKANVSVDTLDKIILVGSFGNHINPKTAEKIGLIPRGTAVITDASRLGAIDGAEMLLFNDNAKADFKKLCEQIETVELANDAYFEQSFIENLYF